MRIGGVNERVSYNYVASIITEIIVITDQIRQNNKCIYSREP